MIIKRTIILGQYLFLLILTSIVAHAQTADTKLNITVPRNTYVLGEPIFVNITLTSSKGVFVLKSLEDYSLRCVVTDINGNKKISKGNRMNVEWRLTGADFFRVDAGNPYYCRKNIIAEYFSDVKLGRFKIKFIFDKLTEPLPKEVEGKIAGYQESNEIEVFIKEPVGQDLSAFELLSSQTNGDKVKSVFDSVLAADIRSELVRKYPESIYAPYALLSQGFYNYQMGSPVKNGKLLNLSIQNYKGLLISYPKFDLIPEARVGLANSYLALRQYELAKQEAQKVIQEYPATFAAQESKKILSKIDAIKG